MTIHPGTKAIVSSWLPHPNKAAVIACIPSLSSDKDLSTSHILPSAGQDKCIFCVYASG
jgi:hypothetical protein